MRTTIFVTFSKHGIHRYPTAPDQVLYLQAEHRHLFKFRVTLETFHNDREVEFHMFQTWLMSLYEKSSQLVLDHKSCEMIAEDLMKAILEQYGQKRDVAIEISEDGECGATLEYTGVK